MKASSPIRPCPTKCLPTIRDPQSCSVKDLVSPHGSSLGIFEFHPTYSKMIKYCYWIIHPEYRPHVDVMWRYLADDNLQTSHLHHRDQCPKGKCLNPLHTCVEDGSTNLHIREEYQSGKKLCSCTPPCFGIHVLPAKDGPPDEFFSNEGRIYGTIYRDSMSNYDQSEAGSDNNVSGDIEQRERIASADGDSFSLYQTFPDEAIEEFIITATAINISKQGNSLAINCNNAMKLAMHGPWQKSQWPIHRLKPGHHRGA